MVDRNSETEPEAAPAISPGIANAILLAIAVIASGSGLFIYVDRDGPGRTQDAEVTADFIQVSANVPGEIIELHVVDNQPVEEGDVLFELDPRPYQAQIEIAQGRHKQALALLADKKELYERTSSLTDDNVASLQQRRDAESAMERASGAVIAAKGDLQLAKLNLGYCTIRAPFDGVVTNLQTQIGEWVTAGQPIFALLDSSSFHVAAYMKEQYLGPAVPGAKVRVTLWQYPDEEFEGVVTSVGRGIQTRTNVAGLQVVEKTLDWVQLAARIPVRIQVETDKPLTMGATAHVRIVDP